MSNNLFLNNKRHSRNTATKPTFMLNSNKACLCDGLSFSVMWAITLIRVAGTALGSSVRILLLTRVRCVTSCTSSFNLIAAAATAVQGLSLCDSMYSMYMCMCTCICVCTRVSVHACVCTCLAQGDQKPACTVRPQQGAGSCSTTRRFHSELCTEPRQGPPDSPGAGSPRPGDQAMPRAGDEKDELKCWPAQSVFHFSRAPSPFSQPFLLLLYEETMLGPELGSTKLESQNHRLIE